MLLVFCLSLRVKLSLMFFFLFSLIVSLFSDVTILLCILVVFVCFRGDYPDKHPAIIQQSLSYLIKLMLIFKVFSL